VILGTEWVASEPFALIKDGVEEIARRVPIAGFRFSYRARPDMARVCLGHRLEEGDAVCGKPVQTGTKTCRPCAIESALFASDLHHAHTRQPSGTLADHLDQPNVLYLAGFGDGSIKVGTSVAHRVETRLLEQGARSARIVASTEDGVTVRVLEDLITETLEIAQTVSVARKLKGLTDPKPDSESTEQLNAFEARTRRFLDDVEGWKPLEESWSNPIVGDRKWRGVFAYPRDLGAGAHDLIAGGAVGRIALLSRPEPGADRFVADLRQLYGVRLERGVFDTPGLAAQHSLF
jgi:hypothetical protein